MDSSNFTQLTGTVECIYAKTSNIANVYRCDGEYYDLRACEEAASSLYSAILRSDLALVDGFLIEFTERSWGECIENLSRTFRAIIKAAYEIEGRNFDGTSHDITSPDWRLKLGKVVLYVVVLAPVYPNHSSRYNGGSNSTFMLFQPKAAFERRWPVGQNSISDRSRIMIRSAFQRAGRSYDLNITTGPLEAHRFIKPTSSGADPVEWWREKDKPALRIGSK